MFFWSSLHHREFDRKNAPFVWYSILSNSRLFFFSFNIATPSYVDKWKEIKYFPLTICHTDVHFGLTLRSAIWTKHCESTTTKLGKKATISCFFSIIIAKTVSVQELSFLVLPWAISFYGELLWFCRELFGFAIRYFIFLWTWICNCGHSREPSYKWVCQFLLLDLQGL